ncbi:uncharacterized protein LOC142346030 [Convolutriloba macropyga]|uniref:uncharacterized protein LOC142346030 n=1 Tax=Convolutriloba macropyga TaxID=536237 RepID=UPI003F51B16E
MITSTLPECVICTDVLDDPRQLSCGHSYCGPSKHCLKTLLIDRKFLKCAICGVFHEQRIEDLKPMYGIREYLEAQKKIFEKTTLPKKEFVSKMLICKTHSENEAKFWCTNCEELICSDCLTSEKHLSHQFNVFEANKRLIVANKLEKLNHLKSDYETNIDLAISKLAQKRKLLTTFAEQESKFILEKREIQQYWNALSRYVQKTDEMVSNEALSWLFDLNYTAADNCNLVFFLDSATETDKLSTKDEKTQVKSDTTDASVQKDASQVFAQTTDRTVAISKSTKLPITYIFDSECSSLSIESEKLEICFPYDENDTDEMTSSIISNKFCSFTLSLRPANGKLLPIIVTLEILDVKKEGRFSLDVIRYNGKLWRVFIRKRIRVDTFQKTSELSKTQQKRELNGTSVIVASIACFS